MLGQLENYELRELIHKGKYFSIYRAEKLPDFSSVIIKILNKDHLHPSLIMRLQHEYDILKKLTTPHVIQAYDLQVFDNCPAIILEDTESTSLEHLLKSETLTFEMKLTIAIEIATAIGEIHQANVIHKDIKPSNILVHLQDTSIKMIDFGLSSQLTREIQEIISPNLLEGTLSYIAPEQTGRMNRSIDYRADIYSLGIVLYQLFTNQLPFVSTNAIELIYQHIARMPIPPHEVNTEIPKSLSLIILKCLSKRAEERYFSAYGLKNDLDKCLKEWKENQSISFFIPGQKDVYDHFQIAEKLYGREEELDLLAGEFGKASEDEARILLLKGYAGVGKTSLINEMHKLVAEKGGYFIIGKCDQFKHAVGHGCLVQAFQNLVQQLLAESDQKLQEWKDRLLSALSPNAQLIIDVIPDLKLILGKQPSVEPISPGLAENRFNYFFMRFIEVFLRPESPLVICLEDLQWADELTLKFLHYFMCDIEHHHLLILGSYRDNEVDKSHPLSVSIEEMTNKGVKIKEIEILPLKIEALQELIYDTFHGDPWQTNFFAHLLYQKTKGNPFFVNQYLKMFYHQKSFNFDPDKQTWIINFEEVEKVQLANNVTDLLVSKVKNLSNSTRLLLSISAAIGRKFDLNTLALVYGKPVIETAEDLAEALEEEFIIQQKGYQKISYAFQHDKIQQIFYQEIPKDQLDAIHFKIGKILLEHLSPEQVEEDIITLVTHLNYGIEFNLSQEEKNQLARFNLLAGLKAKGSISYATAAHFFNTGTKLLPENEWETMYDLTLDLYKNLVYCEQIYGNPEKAEKLFYVVLNHIKTIQEKARLYLLKFWIHTHKGQYELAIQAGLEGLALFGIHEKFSGNPLLILFNLIKLRIYLSNHRPEDFEKIPLVKDENTKIIQDIYLAFAYPAAYAFSQSQYLLFCFKLMFSASKTGLSEASAGAFTAYAYMICLLFKKYKEGYAYSLAVINLLKEHYSKSTTLLTSLLLHYSSIDQWHNPIRHSSLALKKLGRRFIDHGELVYAACSLYAHCYQILFQGTPLEEAFKEIDANYQEVSKYKTFAEWVQIGTLREFCLAMQGKTANPADPRPKGLPNKSEDKGSQSCFFVYSIWQAISLYFNEKYPEALKVCEEVLKYKNYYVVEPVWKSFYFYYALIIFAQADLSSVSKSHRREIKRIHNMFAEWSQVAPFNYLHYYKLICAEQCRVAGKSKEAAQCYDQAIESAKNNHFLQCEALGCELAGKFYLQEGQKKTASFYLALAKNSYTKWGGVLKAHLLYSQYEDLFLMFQNDFEAEENVDFSSSSLTQDSSLITTKSLSQDFDIETLIQASQALSKEIIFEKLLQTLMHLAFINAGADKAFLLLEHEGNLAVQAEISSNEEEAILLQSTPLEQYKDQLCTSIIKYVERSKQILLLRDATQEGQFVYDPYVSSKSPFSVACLPLLKQDHLIGILYLENNLNTGAFSPARLNLLNVLSSQMAISLENAHFYSTLEGKVNRRTKELKDKNQELELTLRRLKLIQNQMIEQEKLASLGLLTSGIAHELKNPLNFIINFSQLAHDSILEMQDKLSTTTADLGDLEESICGSLELIKKIEFHGKRVDEIIKGMLAHANPKLGERDFIDIHSLLEQSIRLASHTLLKKVGINVSFIKNYDQNVQQIKGFAGELERVFLNLIDNACYALVEKNHRAGSQFTPCVNVTTEDKGDHIAIKIKDNGIGISLDNQNKIFEPFFSTKPTGAGTGLGLYIVYEIVTKQHGGTIKVDSEIDHYTEFTITLPKEEGTPPPIPVD